MEDLIAGEKAAISGDPDLRKRYDQLEKLIMKNKDVRAFQSYIADHEEILPHLANLPAFKQELWKSYIKGRLDSYLDLVSKYQAASQRKREIEQAAREQQTEWEKVIHIFNERFFVPFRLVPKNKVPVMLGQDPVLSVGFVFRDRGDEAPIERRDLMEVLSTGEKKALYILNIIYEVEVRRKTQAPTLMVVDDVADSFDYKNKYAIIQYLQEIADNQSFRMILLTHNFDFFRTVSTRFVGYGNSLMAAKEGGRVALRQASGIKNIFVNDWKPNYYSDRKKAVASIPFLRNLVEYMRGTDGDDYLLLTSLLHWRPETSSILRRRVDEIFNGLFGSSDVSEGAGEPVIEQIFMEASQCLAEDDTLNLENKIVLSIASRLGAERYMIEQIDDPDAIVAISSNQTRQLLRMFRKRDPSTSRVIDDVLDRVALMTPENIHLNSFMYEPIVDMASEHLKKLWEDVSALGR